MTQLTLGEHAKEQGQQQVEDHNWDFVSTMREVAIRLSNSLGDLTIDDLREYASNYGLIPKHPAAWGSIFKGNRWKSIGYTKSTLPSNHARMIRIWKYV